MPSEALVAIGLIATSFFATNLDNLALLVTWLVASRGARQPVLVGHLLGMLTLLSFSVGFGFGAEILPVGAIGVLGVIPIALGLRGLYAAARRSERAPRERGEGDVVHPLSVAGTQVANGVDTVLVLGPLLADSDLGVDAVMVAGFIGMAFLWFGLARLLERQARRLRIVERLGEWLAPIMLVAIGIYILLDTSTDVVTSLPRTPR